MKKHKMAGLPVKIENGPLKGKYFQVIDYFQNQYQGKSMDKLAKTKHTLLDPVRQRGKPLDEGVVFGMLLPTRAFTCVHDTELQIVKPELTIVPEGEPDATTGTDTTDSESTQPGKPEPVGRSVPSGKGNSKSKGTTKNKG